ncbi:ABC transporter ATP-binding protein [Nocardia transvalensis]|uniref:ABC transporter ATP-binding protein n=1 Tax=Nocardia transvalensis TaxID=37333 RepID=UPI00189334A3|nr:ATP-binding cassette domain-containing protein [Nocardia transvalensis]MBF6330716.1 ABC transporter ATP-binding protein [Nocardia transvalensis]
MIVVEELSVVSGTGAALLEPISLEVPAGGITALRGPSGCGKSTLLKALLGQVPVGTTATGSVRVREHDVLALDSQALRRFRREEVSFVGQDPGVALNPTMRVRALLGELADAERARAALAAVELPESYLRRRPAELSGGEQRRIALARALARNTPVLLLDEPLAGLHGGLRTAMLRLLRRLSTERGTTILVSGHDTTALRELADEQIPVGSLRLSEPVLATVGPTAPPIGITCPGDTESPAVEPIPAEQVLSLSGVAVSIDRRPVLGDIDLWLGAGEAVAVTGPSGAGKSTLARTVVGLRRPAAGAVRARGRLAFVPQDSTGSLNPRRTVFQTLARPIGRHCRVRGAALAGHIAELLRTVELDPALAQRYPHELSGGQRQRVALARALALDPTVLVCDEITSALDHDTAEAIMDLLDRLRTDRRLSLLVITHDMALVARYCTRMYVMESGRIVESGPVPNVLTAPTHDATHALLG